MKRTKVFYNVLILLAALLLTACQDQKDIPEVSSPEKNLVLSDHISNQKVMSICEDKYGQIWIGTFRGLNKYDGNQYHQLLLRGRFTGIARQPYYRHLS